MHHIYHTEGLILDSRNYGEENKYYTIFTRDLGLIYASARGVRKMASKLRFTLQDFAYIKLDLVEGNEFWKITSASKTGRLEGLKESGEAFKVFYNVLRLLKRLLSGAERNPELFDDTMQGFTFLEKIEKGNKNDIDNVEVVMVLRILSHLGYVGADDLEGELVRSPFEEELLALAGQSKIKIVQKVNRALRESQL